MSYTTRRTSAPQHPAIRIEYQTTALNGVDSVEQSIVDGALNLIAREADASCIPIERISIKRHFSPEDESEELVLTIWADTPPNSALDFWLTLSDAIARWSSTLPQPYKDIAVERIAIAVRSTTRN